MSIISEYIDRQDEKIKDRLKEFYEYLVSLFPEGFEERLTWEMPTFYLYGNVVHFAPAKNHIGFYPGAEGVEHFIDRLGEYKTSKGAIQFPYNKPVPYELIGEITKFRIDRNTAGEEEKRQKKSR